MRTGCCYLRRSKDDPRQLSISRQRDLCLAAAKTHGYEISEDYIEGEHQTSSSQR